jgi:hypothetical protein
MTKQELIKALAPFSDRTDVMVRLTDEALADPGCADSIWDVLEVEDDIALDEAERFPKVIVMVGG